MPARISQTATVKLRSSASATGPISAIDEALQEFTARRKASMPDAGYY